METPPEDPLARPQKMIDVGAKPATSRAARATGRLRAASATVARVRAGDLEKGDALSTARLAGILAAKRTSDVIPLCHPLPLEAVTVTIGFAEPDAVTVEAVVRTTARTGVEMEALLAVSAALLTLYDMTKSIDPGMTIEAVRLEEKTGGVRGDWQRAPGS